MSASEPATKVRRSHAERRDESEQRLLAAAAELLVERGMSAATFDNIAARAGYSRGMVGQRFGSKRGMIEALMRQERRNLAGLLAERTVEQLPGLEGILAFVEVVLDAVGRDGGLRAYFVLAASAVVEPSEMRALFASAHQEVVTALEALYRKGIADGTVRPGINADAAALMTVSLLFGVCMQLLLDPKMDLKPVCETTLSTLRLSLAP